MKNVVIDVARSRQSNNWASLIRTGAVRAAFVLVALSCIGAAPTRQGPSSVKVCSVTIFDAAGRWRPSRLKNGPGLVLSGGGLMGMPYASVLPWIREHIDAPRKARSGNLLILKASGGRDYSDLFYRHSALNSVQEILIPPCVPRGGVDRIAAYVDRVDAVLFSGGDQAHYVIWKGSKLIAAVKQLYARGGIAGGGSAGLAIQGAVIFDSAAAARVLPADQDVATPDAVKDPYERAISFTTDFFDWPPLRGSITDTHFARRNRFGRLAAFMARALADGLVRGGRISGVAVDEGAALLVDARGIATLVERARESDGYVPKGAYLLQGGPAARIRRGQPLLYRVNVTHLTAAGNRYDLTLKRGPGSRYAVTVDGSKVRPYSRSPY